MTIQEKQELENRLAIEQRKRANMEELIDDIEETLFEFKRKEIANGEAKKNHHRPVPGVGTYHQMARKGI